MQVTILNEAAGKGRTVKVDPAGVYVAPNLLPGKYDVSATPTGLATITQEVLTLPVGAPVPMLKARHH